MNTAAKVVIGLGILIIVIGIIMVATGDSFEENAEEGIVYEGADGKTKVENVEPNTGSKYWVHLVDAEFEGGGGGAAVQLLDELVHLRLDRLPVRLSVGVIGRLNAQLANPL